jgi:hypothetical protein
MVTFIAGKSAYDCGAAGRRAGGEDFGAAGREAQGRVTV